MEIVYESMETLIPNAVMRKRLVDGVLRNFMIKPAEGYLLHDNGYDELVYDDDGNETGEVIFGYRSTEGSVGYNYDFAPVQMREETGATVTAYGSRQFFCKPIGEVGEGAGIFGGNTEPETEVMNTETEPETM